MLEERSVGFDLRYRPSYIEKFWLSLIHPPSGCLLRSLTNVDGRFTMIKCHDEISWNFDSILPNDDVELKLPFFENLKYKLSFEMKNNNNPRRTSSFLLLRTIRKAIKEFSHLKDLKSNKMNWVWWVLSFCWLEKLSEGAITVDCMSLQLQTWF
jgi:hypothetical protein